MQLGEEEEMTVYIREKRSLEDSQFSVLHADQGFSPVSTIIRPGRALQDALRLSSKKTWLVLAVGAM